MGLLRCTHGYMLPPLRGYNLLDPGTVGLLLQRHTHGFHAVAPLELNNINLIIYLPYAVTHSELLKIRCFQWPVRRYPCRDIFRVDIGLRVRFPFL